MSIWDPTQLKRVDEEILTPWKKLVALHLDDEHRRVHSTERQARSSHFIHVS